MRAMLLPVAALAIAALPILGMRPPAFVVADGWQERGLGAILLEAVLDATAARGIEHFRADVLADNHRMLRLFTSRTRVEHRITESGVTSLRLRRAAAGAPPRPGRAG